MVIDEVVVIFYLGRLSLNTRLQVEMHKQRYSFHGSTRFTNDSSSWRKRLLIILMDLRKDVEAPRSRLFRSKTCRLHIVIDDTKNTCFLDCYSHLTSKLGGRIL